MGKNMKIKTVILGSSGYVGGELLRLVDIHPNFELVAAVSNSHQGSLIASVFPHLGSIYEGQVFESYSEWYRKINKGSSIAIFSAAPHGTAANVLANTLTETADKKFDIRIVDVSADFRFSNPNQYKKVYGAKHSHTKLLSHFTCGVPEHIKESYSSFVSHPGCFSTSILLPLMPLALKGIVNDEYYISAVTGSTGSGKSPKEGTHHPERHSNLYAYKPLLHRHAPEIEDLVKRTSKKKVKINFVPHSGPFARGIYATLQAKLNVKLSNKDIGLIYGDFYSDSEFVRYKEDPPRLKDVVTTNYCDLNAIIDGNQIVVTCAIDNLIKGAAGGSIQSMNKLWDLDDSTGLLSAATPWV